jgi:superfamily II DNA or RNA helicase
MKLRSRKQIVKPEIVYNLHVEKNHTYFANGAVVSNCHGVKGKVLGDLLCGPGAHVPFRFGVTGTLPSDELSRNQIQAAIGPHIFDLPSWELQALGELAESHINMVALRDSRNDDFLIASQDHEDWLDEVKWLAGCSERINFIAGFVREIAKSGNTLVLTQYRVMGDVLAEALGTTYIDGRMKSDKRVERYKEIDRQNNQIDVASLGVASTGIDIPRLYNIVFVEPGRAMIKTMQAIGRGLRISSGSDGMEAKTLFTLWDIHGDAGFAESHATERKRLYKKAKHKIETLEVDYL